MTTTIFKTINEIKEMEVITNKKRYYRDFDYTRRIALTKFVEQMENERQDFKIVTCSPSIAHTRTRNEHDKEKTEKSATFVIGSWVAFEVNDTQYYIQIDDNPFFDSYISASVIDHEKKTKKSTGMMKINETLYKNVEYANTEENINQVVENLKEVFNNVNLTHWKNEKYLSYRDKNEQTIYTH